MPYLFPPSFLLCQVGDDDRGYLLELLLTKLRYATMDCNPWSRAEGGGGRGGGTGASPSTASPPRGADSGGLQVIGMSATMSNVDQVGRGESLGRGEGRAWTVPPNT